MKYLQFETNRHGRRVVYFRRGNEPRARLPDDVDSPEFRVAYWAAFEGRPLPHVRDMPVTAVEFRKQRTERVLVGALRSASTRARNKRVPFTLTVDELLALAERQEFRCALTGIEFFATPGEKATSRVSPFTPSIDRIVPSLGYTPENIRIVIFAVNSMLLDWGEATFRQVADSYRYHQRKPKGERSSPLPVNGNRPAPYIKSTT